MNFFRFTQFFGIFCCLSFYLHAADLDVNSLTLDEYIRAHGMKVSEGHCRLGDTDQPQYLKEVLANNPQIKVIGEIGFNAGHSSELFLQNTNDTKIYSFDIMSHKYAAVGKSYIDQKYPSRHTLIPGNSLKTIPQFSSENPELVFDLIFLDGGHSYHVAYNDIINISKFADENTILIIDDICKGSVKKAYQDCVKNNLITKGELFKSKHKAWIQCHYIINN